MNSVQVSTPSVFKMRWLGLISPMFVALSACTTVPGLPPHQRVNAADVLDAVQCQLKEAIDGQSRDHQWLKSWGVQLTLTLEANRTAGAGASATWIIPDVIRGITVGAAADASVRATRRGFVTYTLLVAEVLKHNCDTYVLDPKRPFYQGDLGIGEWIRDVTASMGPDDVVEKPDKFGHTVEFSLSESASLKPIFTFVNVSVSGGVESRPNDLYILDLAFSDNPPPDPLGKRVFVTNLPAAIDTTTLMPPIIPETIGRTKVRRGSLPPDIPQSVSPQLRQRLDATTQELQLRGLNLRR